MDHGFVCTWSRDTCVKTRGREGEGEGDTRPSVNDFHNSIKRLHNIACWKFHSHPAVFGYDANCARLWNRETYLTVLHHAEPVCSNEVRSVKSFMEISGHVNGFQLHWWMKMRKSVASVFPFLFCVSLKNAWFIKIIYIYIYIYFFFFYAE